MKGDELFGTGIPEEGMLDDLDNLLQGEFKMQFDMEKDAQEVDNQVVGKSPSMAEFSIQDFHQTLDIPASNFDSMQSVSDVISESLGAVSSLEDQVLEEQYNDILANQVEVSLDMEVNKKGAKKKEQRKKSFFARFFANQVDESETLEQFQEEERLRLAKQEDKTNKINEMKKAKEEAKAKRIVLKEEKKKEKLKLKELKRESKRKEQEAMEATYVPQGKINKVGATIVMIAVSCFGVFVLLGTVLHSYQVSVDHAKLYIEGGHYSKAYQLLSGLTIKEKDRDTYDGLETIMLVQKQLNSYYNFKELDMEMEALDSLFKGLERYDRYYETAKKYEVTQVFQSFKSEIYDILKTEYGLSKEKVNSIRKIENDKTYSKELMSLVKK